MRMDKILSNATVEACIMQLKRLCRLGAVNADGTIAIAVTSYPNDGELFFRTVNFGEHIQNKYSKALLLEICQKNIKKIRNDIKLDSDAVDDVHAASSGAVFDMHEHGKFIWTLTILSSDDVFSSFLMSTVTDTICNAAANR